MHKNLAHILYHCAEVQTRAWSNHVQGLGFKVLGFSNLVVQAWHALSAGDMWEVRLSVTRVPIVTFIKDAKHAMPLWAWPRFDLQKPLPDSAQ